MTRKQFFGATLMALAAILSSGALNLATAQSKPSAALAGQVSSQEEGPMEGVLVSARREGSTVTFTVVSDAQGRYSFPRAKLEPGRYSLRIRAVGYELNDPGPVEATAQKTSEVDLKLRKTGDLANQLTNAEWIMSMPGTEEQKRIFLGCVGCHTLERIVRSRYDSAQFVPILRRMAAYYPGTTLQIGGPGQREETIPERLAERAAYLSTINLSTVSRWQYPLKTLPRPTGKATRVIITEYELPRPDAQPHDVVVDAEGIVWYNEFGGLRLGKLNPKTAQTVEYTVPEIKPGFPPGMNSVELDRKGNVWLGLRRQGGIVKFDPRTEKFQTWRHPEDVDNKASATPMVMPGYSHLDGKVWFNNAGINAMHRLDVRSGQIETVHPYREIAKDSPAATRPHSIYGIAADSQNNSYVMDFSSEYIGKVDAKTLKTTLYPTPTFGSTPRRGRVDSQDRLWFAEFTVNKIGMFDSKTERFQEWTIPTPWSSPYYVVADKNGEAWTGGMTTDRVARLNTKAGEWIEYLLPRSANIRRVDVDNSTTPVTFWVGNNHGASIIKLEPLE